MTIVSIDICQHYWQNFPVVLVFLTLRNLALFLVVELLHNLHFCVMFVFETYVHNTCRCLHTVITHTTEFLKTLEVKLHTAEKWRLLNFFWSFKLHEHFWMISDTEMTHKIFLHVELILKLFEKVGLRYRVVLKLWYFTVLNYGWMLLL